MRHGTFSMFFPKLAFNCFVYAPFFLSASIKRVDIKSTVEEIICTTNEVYPKPVIDWYENDSLIKKFTIQTQRDEQGLFSLKSTFRYKENEQNNANRNIFKKQNLIYNCSISFEDKSQTYTACLRQGKRDTHIF